MLLLSPIPNEQYQRPLQAAQANSGYKEPLSGVAAANSKLVPPVTVRGAFPCGLRASRSTDKHLCHTVSSAR